MQQTGRWMQSQGGEDIKKRVREYIAKYIQGSRILLKEE
jgi:hypothetical protein